MKTTIAATLTISVHLIVDSVKTISYAVHGTIFYLYSVHLLKKTQRWAPWEAYVGGVCASMIPLSDHNAAALSPLTYAASLASYREGEVAWKTVRRSATTNAFF